MTYCATCATSDWHPDTRTCPLPHCQLRGSDAREGAGPATPADACAILPVGTSTGGAVTAAGGLFDKRAGDCQPKGLGCAVERVPVHVTHVSGKEASVCVE